MDVAASSDETLISISTRALLRRFRHRAPHDMMHSKCSSTFVAQFFRLNICSTHLRPRSTSPIFSCIRSSSPQTISCLRSFSTTSPREGNWLLPTQPEKKRSRKGRPRVPTGGSSRGTTIVWGDYGLRMCDHHRRVSASQLKNGEEAIKVRLRGMRYRLYKRVCANIGVYSSGNEVW